MNAAAAAVECIPMSGKGNTDGAQVRNAIRMRFPSQTVPLVAVKVKQA